MLAGLHLLKQRQIVAMDVGGVRPALDLDMQRLARPLHVGQDARGVALVLPIVIGDLIAGGDADMPQPALDGPAFEVIQASCPA